MKEKDSKTSIPDDTFERLVAAENNTQARKKIRNYALAIFQSAEFIEELADIRRKHGIPENGYGGNISKDSPTKETSLKKIEKDIEVLCKKYKLHYVDWFQDVEHLLYFDEFEDIFDLNSKSLLLISDLVYEKTDPYSAETQEQDDKHFPIALKISPYATRRDIIDFIKKKYKLFILPLQKNYREDSTRIGKLRLRNEKITKRNNFIYKNRTLPRKDIVKLVSKEFGEVLDYGHISKIISLENQRREKMNT